MPRTDVANNKLRFPVKGRFGTIDPKYNLTGREGRDVGYRERLSALRVEQNLQEEDPRRRRSHSSID
jgi:hypothetical protein